MKYKKKQKSVFLQKIKKILRSKNLNCKQKLKVLLIHSLWKENKKIQRSILKIKLLLPKVKTMPLLLIKKNIVLLKKMISLQLISDYILYTMDIKRFLIALLISLAVTYPPDFVYLSKIDPTII